jgi:hypothetical protein
MKEFFLILFFGKAVLLTPVPIDINASLVLEFDEPVSAVTPGASVLIDVSAMLTAQDREHIQNSGERVSKLFPDGSITAQLTGTEGASILLTFDGGFLIGDDAIELALNAQGGVPTDLEFKRMVIESTVELKGVSISWKNYKH